MRRVWESGILRGAAAVCLVFGCVAATGATAWAQGKKVPGAPKTHLVRVLLVSDIHFEPFWDPAKVAKLAATPVAKWSAILTEPDSADRAEQFAALQQTCHARGPDTSERLLDSSMRAIGARAAESSFVVLSGDLVSHDFKCKYATEFPSAKPGGYRDFVVKTIQYVIGRLRGAAPGVPVYPALGNNDTACGDDQIDAHSEFLGALAKAMTADVPKSERRQARIDFAAGGYYGVRLPAAMAHTRLLVLDDLFMSRGYRTCSGKADPVPGAAQIAWLKQQLSGARQNEEHVWVMAHIPPGFPPNSRVARKLKFCAGGPPHMSLSSFALEDMLGQYGDVVRLTVFGHTHKDEIKLLDPPGSRDGGVPLKVVPSITPIAGNNPSFIVAEVDPATARMKDYQVIMASNRTGVDTRWEEEYDFAKAYKEPDFSPASVRKLVERFERDPKARTVESQSYIRNYTAGRTTVSLRTFWPQYACAMNNGAVDAFRACVCGKQSGSMK